MAQEIARRGGADWIETDVQLSRDGVPFILNDRTIDRTTDGSGPIENFLAEDLKRLDAGSWFAPIFAGLRLPTLAEQLADLVDRGGNLLLEIKGQPTPDEVTAILALVAAADLPGRVAIQSFAELSLRHARTTAPDLPRGLLRPVLDDDPVSVARELGLTSYNIKGSALLERPAAVERLHGAGVAVFVWSIDSAQQWAEFDHLGVDGIITNRPLELAGWNAARAAETFA